MNLPFAIARKYWLSARLPGAVNIITAISMFGIAVGVALLIIVLSVFNGFHVLIRDYYEAFDADLIVEPRLGKFMPLSEDTLKRLQSLEGVAAATYVLEGKAIVKNGDKQHIVLLKGVTKDFTSVSGVRGLVKWGQYGLRTTDGDNTLVMGAGIAAMIQAGPEDWTHPLELFAISARRDLLTSDPEQSLLKEYVYAAGMFTIQKEYDETVVLADRSVAERLFEAKGRISNYALRLKNDDDVAAVKARLEALFGPKFVVKTWYEQHETIYQVMRNEKAVGYLLICFMLLLISFNIVGCLSMIVIEKRGAIGVLLTLGATPRLIRNIFLWESALIGGVGGAGGLLLGYGFCVLQARQGILRFDVPDDAAFLIDAFPVAPAGADFVTVFFTVLGLTLASGWYPAWRAARLRAVDCVNQK